MHMMHIAHVAQMHIAHVAQMHIAHHAQLPGAAALRFHEHSAGRMLGFAESEVIYIPTTALMAALAVNADL